MTDFYIFRHGDTNRSNNPMFHWLVDKLETRKDTHNLGILPKGIPALKRIGEYLKEIATDADYCSPYVRCIESAKIVSDIASKKYKFDNRIRELENKGENFSSFRNRVESFLKEIKKRNYSSVSICTHGAVIAAIKNLTIHGTFYRFQVFSYSKPGQLLIIKNGKVDRIDFNS